MRQTRRIPAMKLLEELEPRQLMSGLPVLLSASPHFVLGNASTTLLGTLAEKGVTIPEDAGAGHGPMLQVTVNWGDGSTSPAILHRDGTKIQVWGGHAYAGLKVYGVSLAAATDSSAPKVVLRRNVPVQLNADRGMTLNMKAGVAFSGTVGTVDRTAGLPKLAVAARSIDLPAGAKFAQYTVGATGGTATFHIDWGDGVVSDATVISSGNGKYRVLGNHTYSAAGAYRVVTYVVIDAPDRTLLHVDMINSTARVRGGFTVVPNVALLGHQQVSWSDVLPAGTTLQLTNEGGTGTSGGAGGAIVTSGVRAGVLTINAGQFTGSGAGSVTLSTGNVAFSGGISGSGATLTIVRSGVNSYQGSVLLNGTASGLLTLGGVGSAVLGSSINSGTLTGGILNSGARTGGFNLQLPGGLVFNNTGSGTVGLNLLEPWVTVGTITTGGTLIGAGTASIDFGAFLLNSGTLGLGGLLISNGTVGTLHFTGGKIIVPTSPILQAPWSIHADGTITFVSGSSPLTLDSASDAGVIPQRHGGELVYDADVPLTVVETTVGLLPGDFSGTITLPAGLDVTGVVMPAGAVVV